MYQKEKEGLKNKTNDTFSDDDKESWSDIVVETDSHIIVGYCDELDNKEGALSQIADSRSRS